MVIFTYEIQPTNFDSLPDEKQETLLIRFASLLNTAGKITMTLAREHVDFRGQRFYTNKTYVSSPEEQLDDYLASLGFKFRLVDAAPTLEILSENTRHVVVKYTHDGPDSPPTGRFGRLFVLTGLRPAMPPAWINSLLQHCQIVVVRARKIDSDQALGMAQKYKSTIEAAAAKKPSLIPRLERAAAVYQGLQAQRTALFYTSVSCAILANSNKDLDIRSKSFIKNMKAAEVRFDVVPFLQRDAALGTWRKDLILELGSLAIAFPFVSSDLLEIQGGILLGQNVITKAPVVYDYRLRDNYNVWLLAASGSGKSVTAKVILKRMTENHPDAHVYVVDPQGEYEQISDYFGLAVSKLTDGKCVRRMGFDPYELFDPIDVPQVICDIAKADSLARNEITAKSASASSIFDLYDKVDEHAKKHLVQLVQGPFAELFKKASTDGTTNNNISTKTVISLEGAFDNEEREGVLLTLALARAWKSIVAAPRQLPKILVIDEGWLLFKIPTAARFVEMIARTGRKLNVLFLFITQRPADVLESEKGRVILENSDTRILLRNAEIASQEVANALWLSKRERDILPLLMKGEALIFTGEHRLRVRVTPSSQRELAIFSTSPNNSSVAETSPASPDTRQ
ncbi:MAG TPA: ATP-binding protein [Nitrososphaera sp.]|nr:ATP-binding protein [Nitrososphaera sp.]